MLNRRILRVKAMQSLYAYHQAKLAGYQVALQELTDSFNPDPNSMEQPDPEEVKLNKKLAREAFEALFDKAEKTFSEEVDTHIRERVVDYINDYHKSVSKDRLHYKKLMVREVEKIYERFLKILALPMAFARLNEQEKEQSEKKHIKTPESSGKYNLFNNPFLTDLKEDTAYQALFTRYNATWTGEWETVKSWYRTILKKDAEYQKYALSDKPSLQQHLGMVDYIFRQIILKNDEFEAFFELWDLNWAEDKEIIKSLIKKTVKSYSPGSSTPFEVFELSINWEDDKQYFEDLYKYTIDNGEEYEDIIAAKSKNWEIDRISMTDKIILEMAIAEMINFPSIPVKVTINEYIELSKKYSTPKSKQFVNGVLDVLSNDLQQKGVIKKSGRGLIDNQ